MVKTSHTPTQCEWYTCTDDPTHCSTSAICQLEGQWNVQYLKMNAEKDEVLKQTARQEAL